MSNTTERERLLKLMETEGMTAKQFATEVGIQAGTISNIVNGRNKPSLEVMQKVLHRFRTIQSDWLVLGSGSMYRPIGDQTAPTLFDDQPLKPAMIPIAEESNVPQPAPLPVVNANLPDGKPSPHKEMQGFPVMSAMEHGGAKENARKIEKIVVFYSDGTYENFTR